MANRNFNRVQALEKEIKELFMEVTIGATGAPTVVQALGVTSIARNGAGDYTITLDDKYNSLKFFEAIQLDTSAQDINFQLHSEDVDGAKTIRFLCLTGASATELASGNKLYVKIELKNSSSL